MVIGKINNVFAKHHRVLFGGIVLVVIVTFVFYFSDGSILDISFGGSRASGVKVFGKSVPQAELQQQVRCSILQDVMRFGGMLNSELLKRSEDNAYWQAPVNLALLEVAEQRGIGCTDTEVDEVLVRYFMENGKFSESLMNNYLQNVLAPLGMDVTLLRDALRRQLIVGRLQNEMMELALSSETEDAKKQFAKFANAAYKVQITEFNAQNFLAAAVVPAEEVKAYYDANVAEFTIPAEYYADIVFFPYADPALSIEAAKLAADESALFGYFELNKDRYATTNAKNELVPAEFTKVKDKVTADFISQEVEKLVGVRADAFASHVYDVLGNGKASRDDFRKLAENDNFKVFVTKTFNLNSTAVELANGTVIASKDFVHDLTGVSMQIPVSNVYPAENGLYIAYVNVAIQEGVKPLEEVSAQITDKLKQDAAVRLARQAAQDAAAKIAALPLAEQAGTLAAMPQVNVVKSENVSAGKPADIPNGSLVALAASLQMINETSQPLEVDNGTIMVTLLGQKINPAPAGEVESVQNNYFQAYYSAFNREFQNYLYSNIEIPQDFYARH